jgi:hypothetical protein
VPLVCDLAGEVHGLVHEALVGILGEVHHEVVLVLVEVLNVLQALCVKTG